VRVDGKAHSAAAAEAFQFHRHGALREFVCPKATPEIAAGNIAGRPPVRRPGMVRSVSLTMRLTRAGVFIR
jgi:hypothetical protein